jgi:regulator of ribosome biosynthesis
MQVRVVRCWRCFLLNDVNVLKDAEYDPAKEARVARKERMAKNERKHLQNVAQAQHGRPTAATAGTGTGARKRDIDRTLATTRTSTASMGKFDRVLDGEKKLRGVKRKVKTTTATTYMRCVLNTAFFPASSTRSKSRRKARIWPLSNKLEMAARRRR